MPAGRHDLPLVNVQLLAPHSRLPVWASHQYQVKDGTCTPASFKPWQVSSLSCKWRATVGSRTGSNVKGFEVTMQLGNRDRAGKLSLFSLPNQIFRQF